MYKKIFIPAVLCTALICTACTRGTTPEKTEAQVMDVTSYTAEAAVAPIPIVTGDILSEREIGLIALVTMAEAEGECEEGKRLVIDTILNRVDHGYFPDTVYEVIYQPAQFSSMWDGRAARCRVTNEMIGLVREELVSRRDRNVVFFNAYGYSVYGRPMFQVGNHYFSSYE